MTNKPTTPEIFPQHLAGKRKGKPSIAEIVRDGLKTDQTYPAIIRTIAAVHPNATMSEIRAAVAAEAKRLEEEAERLSDEAETFAEVNDVVDQDGTETGSLLDAARAAAERGDPRGTALFNKLQTDELHRFERDFKAAIALDPYWQLDERGAATRRKGATYRTPEELVAAYRAGRLGGSLNG